MNPADLTAQHSVLVPEHQQLGILGHLGPGQHHQATQQTTYKLVDGRNDHSAMVPAPASPSRPDPLIEPHRLRRATKPSSPAQHRIKDPLLHQALLAFRAYFGTHKLQRLVRLEELGDLQGWLVQGMRIISERTPASWSNSALPSVVSRMRFFAAAVAAIIRS
jgi:hypothetical protein